ncbi:MAG: carbamoyltransferase HypF [Streptomycetales bacterium]
MIGSAARTRSRVRVEGVVQGVGFRPFVYALALRHELAGLVGNDPDGVFIEVEGEPESLTRFRTALEREAPPLALIDRISVEAVEPRGGTRFVIVDSKGGGERRALIAPDTATCADCLREMSDNGDRRHRYPFTNCTNCGPRFTIIRDVPYDRPSTTMADFAMCGDCAREYHDPADRRFHAQPVCCPACGPSLQLIDARGKPVEGDPLDTAAALLRDGKIVAIKGLGGYHLAADATSEPAAGTLRSRKHREDKPFAVMVADVETARRLCTVDEAEERALTSPRRPIVLLRRHPDTPVAGPVAPGNRFLGVMLPYTPLHHLLARELPGPFVLTSGNASDEPIAYHDEDAMRRLAGITDAYLTHDRPIHIRTDDSVTRLFRGRELPVRRSRGYAPQPLALAAPLRRAVLGCGAELKNTFCLAKSRRAFVSHHIGDLENYETLRSYTEGIEHFRRLFDIRPQVVAHDLHPEYLSTKYARQLDCDDSVELVGVQHHHAHVASCLTDNAEHGRVIGVAFDGLGYGTDGTIWGGEFLVADLAGFERRGSLAPVPMPGGTAAIRQPWRMAAAYLDAAYGGAPPAGLAVTRRNPGRWASVTALARKEMNAPATSSAGRLFDAVAALTGVRDTVNYEGQAAIELEQSADLAERAGYPAAITGDDPFRVQGTDLVRAVVDDLRAGVGSATIAARFHRGVAAAIVAGCERIRDEEGLAQVALSGGVFQNQLLLHLAVEGLEQRGFRVLVHHRVPPNDGGVSLGQVAVAAARERAAG